MEKSNNKKMKKVIVKTIVLDEEDLKKNNSICINLDEKMDEDSNENEFRIDLEHESGSVGKSDVKKGFSITINL